MRIERHAAPVAAADPAREDDAELRAILRVGAAGHGSALKGKQVAAELLVRGREFCYLGRLKTVTRENGRLQWKGLRGPRLIAAARERIVGNDGALLDSIDRFSSHAIEDEEQTLLSDYSDGGNDFSFVPDVEENRRRG